MSDYEKISREVQADRARFAESLDDLTSAVSAKRVTDELVGTATELSNELANKAWNVVRENPAGGLLTAIGIALMAQSPRRPVSDPPLAQPPEQAMAGFDDRVAQADERMKDEMTGLSDYTRNASTLRAKVDDVIHALPPKAQKRVLAAQQKALSAQKELDDRARRMARKTSGFIHEQPLAAAAIAVGFGVLAGSLIPGTRREDEMLGQHRDRLFADAYGILQDELQRAQVKGEDIVRDVVKATEQHLN